MARMQSSHGGDETDALPLSVGGLAPGTLIGDGGELLHGVDLFQVDEDGGSPREGRTAPA